MYYSALDLLACPKCKHHPLELYVIEEARVEKEVEISQTPFCSLYCGYRKTRVDELAEPPCYECLKREVIAGILVCRSCGAWYPISRGIPVMLVEEKLRKKPVQMFLEKYGDKIPVELRELVKSG
ncbi:MAG: Trm112 family protein [Desulfurococcales archaeon]|nr:Trm112 family protein [Desulfurococcales archaeon]